jgi:hypothetical protein
MDYCTAGPQYASGGFIADSQLPARRQRLAAAVADPQQRVGGWSNGVWNQVFSGVGGAPGRRGFPTRRTPRSTRPGQPREAVPVRRRRGRTASACRRRSRHRGITWATADAGAHDPAARLLRRQAARLGAGDQRPLAAASTCCSPRACTTSPAASRSSARHGGARPRARHAHRRRRRRPLTSPTCPASSSPGVTIDAGPASRRAAAGRTRSTAGATTARRGTRPRCPTSTSASAAAVGKVRRRARGQQ